MKFNISKKWLLKAANKEDKMPVSAGTFTFDMVADDAEEKHMVVAEEPCAYLSVFGRLINLRRRERGLTLEQLADTARIDLDELVGIEQVLGYTPEPRTVCQLAAVLKLPKNRLLQLSGCVEEQDEALTQQSVRFAARSDALEKLTREQKQALDEYIRYLEKSDEALEG
jgi:HTH-type transcriptional regulator, competence development regulator